MADDKPKPDPKPLSTEYHKAHKQLMLWSAILFIWELVGIDLEKAKETGGNAGAIISAIKTPRAVPWALVILVAYFLFKTTVEWFQCSLTRRTLGVARIDFVAAWVVPLTAFSLYVFQAIKQVQLADVILSNESKSVSFLMGAAVVFIFVLSQKDILSDWQKIRSHGTYRRRFQAVLAIVLLIAATVVTLLSIAKFGPSLGGPPLVWTNLLWGFLSTAIVYTAIRLAIHFNLRGRFSQLFPRSND